MSASIETLEQFYHVPHAIPSTIPARLHQRVTTAARCPSPVPIFLQTSFERKMRVYLTAHAAKQHEKHFGWKTFRVLTVTTDQHRMQSMMEAVRRQHS